MKTLVFGAGGGGDIVSALVPYLRLSRSGHKVYLASVVWERRVEDPLPGPICNDSLREVEVVNKWVSVLTGKSYAVRGSRVVIPQAVKVAKLLGTEVLSLCLGGGVEGLSSSLEEISESFGLDLVMGVDAGGDVLATGKEEGLSSPLADSISLASLTKLKRRGLNTILQVLGLGADGELDPNYLLNRVSTIASKGGLLEVGGLDREVSNFLDSILDQVTTEASKIPVLAFRGKYGEVSIRNGLAKVLVSPIQAVSFSFDPEVVFQDSLTAQAVYDSASIHEANAALNGLGLYTELDLERDLYALYGERSSEAPPDVVRSLRNPTAQKRFNK